MSKKLKKNSTALTDGDYPFPLGTKAYENFFKNCIKNDSDYEEGKLNEVGGKFSLQMLHVQQEITQFRQDISNTPLMAIIFLWAQWISNDRVLGEKYLEMMQYLLNKKLVPHKHPIDNIPVTIAEFASWNSHAIVDDLRCHEDFSIDKRETFVEFYKEFSFWLSQNTFGMIPIAIDHDREITQQRKMPFETYVQFLTNLELRERIMTKIFYLGGSVALEEVLSLEIKDIDFNGSTIRLGEVMINYPPHVFEDVKSCIDGRKKGYLFVGRQNDRINHTVPYRALKAVAVRLGFGSDFTFKEFIKNK